MSRVCNNVSGQCYYVNGGYLNSSLENELGTPCYLPTECPQNVNTPYEWIFQIPTEYTALLELNNVTDCSMLNNLPQQYNYKYSYLEEPLEWIFRCDKE